MAGLNSLIMVCGMGDDPEHGTDAWAKKLFDAEVQSDAHGRFVKTKDGKVYLFEVFYNDLNNLLLKKFEGLKRLYESSPVGSKELKSHVHDVIVNVMVPDMINAVKDLFLLQYNKVLETIVKLQCTNEESKIGVLSHSLGTYIAYEGLYAVCRSNEIVTYIDLGLVMAAPMLSPIYNVQSMLGLQNYLTQNCSSKPFRLVRKNKKKGPIKNCLAIYNTMDPFYQIHSDKFYDPIELNNDLVDKFITYTDGPNSTNLNTHSMENSYILHNRQEIIKALFGGNHD